MLYIHAPEESKSLLIKVTNISPAQAKESLIQSEFTTPSWQSMPGK
jgi:hypothetical protein